MTGDQGSDHMLLAKTEHAPPITTHNFNTSRPSSVTPRVTFRTVSAAFPAMHTAFAVPAALNSTTWAPGASSVRVITRRGRLVGAAPIRRGPAGLVMSAVPAGADKYDVLLGEMAFTEPDLLPALVQSRMDVLTDDFYAYIDKKVAASADLEERETLRLLSGAIKQLQGDSKLSMRRGTGSSSGSAVGEAVGAFDMVDVAGEGEVADATYDALIERMVTASGEDDGEIALASTVEVEYEAIDKRLLDRLEEQVAGEADVDRVAALTAVKAAIGNAMSSKMKEAAEKLKDVIMAGPPVEMRKKMETLAVKGSIDDAFILLLQGNLQQAEAAGVAQAVSVMSSLLEHASFLKDARLAPEVRLIRSLIRTKDSETRMALLTTALKPNTGILLADGKTKTTGVRVNGKKFVVALRELIEKYSNIEEGFAKLLNDIGEESEAVARQLFDMEEKDVRDLQREAFNKRSVSVWDLEKIEMQEELEGRSAGWEGRLGDMPAGFDQDGNMRIGG
jgi:hypothetical protein